MIYLQELFFTFYKISEKNEKIKYLSEEPLKFLVDLPFYFFRIFSKFFLMEFLPTKKMRINFRSFQNLFINFNIIF